MAGGVDPCATAGVARWVHTVLVGDAVDRPAGCLAPAALAGDILAARDTARVREWIIDFLEPR